MSVLRSIWSEHGRGRTGPRAQPFRAAEVRPGRVAGNVESRGAQDRAGGGTRVRRGVIVDDNEQFLAVARDHLSRGGLQIVGTAMNQAEALRQADALHPDVVLVDIGLGGESGFEVARRLVADVPGLGSSVVLISTRDEEDLADLIAASPAIGFIPKNLLSVRAIESLLGPRPGVR
ncbi:response regulator receiver domain-containing protein [Pseudonocardia hierapolitana]|uniref:Response regulator receiver domain-containing protein n=1 Tax=Pseudonocardia hierapolitana TaxID=1128676 RepID=A0A561T269_9PSEU|nr:response regulator [Pseudonocardia hierapolitana]TWF81207.1 response regulator receiver domain-containing protein [Pseudonocardia hierapolitana]